MQLTPGRPCCERPCGTGEHRPDCHPCHLPVTGRTTARVCEQGRHLDLALWMRFFSGAWLPSTSMASPAPAEASRCRLRPTLLTERLRALAIALLASSPTLSREACVQD